MSNAPNTNGLNGPNRVDVEKSMELFTKEAFKKEMDKECPEHLKELAEKIVDKCEGSPLALTLTGSFLSGCEKTRPGWEKALTKLSYLEKKEKLSGILKLSYSDLPYHLKWCYLYLSAFPQNYKIEVEKLIKLWVAEGFVREEHVGNGNTQEDVAREYLEMLEQSSLVQVKEEFSEQDSFCLSYCSVHRLLWELSAKEAEKASFMFFLPNGTLDATFKNEYVRRLSLRRDTSTGSSLNLVNVNPKLWTLLNFTSAECIRFQRFDMLKVLDLEGSKIKKLPDKVGDMKLLRYLSVKNTTCFTIPTFISNFSKLETLDWHCKDKKEIRMPKEIRKIASLKHLRGNYINCNLDDVSHLGQLQTLETVILHQVKNLTQSWPNLRKLDICITANWDIHKRATVWSILQKLAHLEYLRVESLAKGGRMRILCGNDCFSRLRFLILKLIIIQECVIEERSMQSLESIKLQSCWGSSNLLEGMRHKTKFTRLVVIDADDNFLKWWNVNKERFQNVKDDISYMPLDGP